jgi:hypothetical protein
MFRGIQEEILKGLKIPGRMLLRVVHECAAVVARRRKVP